MPEHSSVTVAANSSTPPTLGDPPHSDQDARTTDSTLKREAPANTGHDLTQAELAERCGIDQADISRIERGATSPTARTLQRTAAALDADVRVVARAS
ncbi:helix-turn-helix domain-containing protein [Candidatus Poriferisodalis sp.]|uniref:helix-turn-helix domain-containing protein n=1 Tax=Candidatus Poriferisodalis sp. TaxID=3101277 RepID=UPI003D0D34BB